MDVDDVTLLVPASLRFFLSPARRAAEVSVPADGTSAARDYDVAIGQYQMLTQLNSNPTNEPLRPSAVTLSRTNLITFQ